MLGARLSEVLPEARLYTCLPRLPMETVRIAEIPAGTRVQVRYTLLEPGERAPGIPADTARVPYQVRVRGLLVSPVEPGASATVRTPTGRLVEGELEIVEPADTHSFGRPVPALVESIDAIETLKRSFE